MAIGALIGTELVPSHRGLQGSSFAPPTSMCEPHAFTALPSRLFPLEGTSSLLFAEFLRDRLRGPDIALKLLQSELIEPFRDFTRAESIGCQREGECAYRSDQLLLVLHGGGWRVPQLLPFAAELHKLGTFSSWHDARCTGL